MIIRIALAQMNPTVGDIGGNGRWIQEWSASAIAAGADLVAFPELALTGYPPEDLVLRSSFVADNLKELNKLAKGIRGVVAIVGFLDLDDEGIYNAAAILSEGKIRGIYRKHELPNYGVFDEERYFERGGRLVLGKIGDAVFGLTICEDLWKEDGPHQGCASAGASLIININGSPFHAGKGSERLDLLTSRAKSLGVTFAYVNMVGGQDELVFDGGSLVVGPEGDVTVRAAEFKEELLVFDFEPQLGKSQPTNTRTSEGVKIVDLPVAKQKKEPLEPKLADSTTLEGQIYAALVMGVRDYFTKNGFKEAVVGLSGGIDSALTAAIAVDALGQTSVTGVQMPGEFTSSESSELAGQLIKNLGIRSYELRITDSYEALVKALDPAFSGTEPGVAEENLQSRIRGLLLMAISNKRAGCLVLSTGNKSELATGYATLYGDMVGGFAVLKDVPKTLVWKLAKFRNGGGKVIPQRIIDRPPTAELRPNQADTDSLPAYDILDPILEAYVEADQSLDEIVNSGFERRVVEKVARLVDAAEYKRRQAPPGIKITPRAFGRDRRVPITNRYGDKR